MWMSFDREPERNTDVLVWCGHDLCVKHITDFRSEEASNNWLLWMPCPSPTHDEIEWANRKNDAATVARLDALERLSAWDQELERRS